MTDREVLVKEGRFGEYVTDGEANASLQQGDSVERIDIMRASELLTIRRQKMELNPTPKKAKKSAKKKSTKKSTKKTSAKRGAKKATTTKSTTAPAADAGGTRSDDA